jgi:hypothetical protein
MLRLKRAAQAAALVLIAGCTADAGKVLGPSDGPSRVISDAAHAGAVPGFYFLPPMVPQPSYSGTFDAGLTPRVEICELSGTSCGANIATFAFGTGSSNVRLSAADQSYQVNWHTKDYNLNVATMYRISVYQGTFLLGFADVDVVGSGKDLKNVDTQQFIALLDDRTLPIKFRVETGIVREILVTPATAEVNVGGTQQFTATLVDLHGNAVAGPAVTWSSSAAAVATVDGTGLATGVSPGTAMITASIGYVSGSATLTVVQPNLPPVANPDTFQAIGNVTVPVAAPGVLANDTDPDGDALGVVADTVATANGGTAILHADGSFTYLSAAGFTGTDSFEYQVTDGIEMATATVTITVATRVWYVSNAGTAPGDGRDASPFVALKSAEAAAAAGETIFLLAGDGSTTGYDEGIILKNGQSLTGQGVAADVAVTLNGQQVVLLDAGSAPTVTRTDAGTTVQLAVGNTVQGVHVASSNGAGIAGSGFGTFTASAVSVGVLGGAALEVQNGTVAASLGSVSSSNSAGAGLSLVGLSGSLSATGGAINGAAGAGVAISGGNAGVDYAGSISGSGAGAAVIAGRTGGAVVLSGSISDTGNGIVAQNNTGGTISFTGSSKSLSTGAANGVTLANNSGAAVVFGGGGLAISTTTGTGFSATGGGTVTVTGANNTVSAAGGRAVNVVGATIGASGISFRSVSASGGANAIVLSNTGAANGFQVTGDGSTPGSGGIIQNTTDDAVVVTNAVNVELEFMRVLAPAGDGVSLSGVTGFALNGTLISGTGDHGVRVSGGSGFSMLNGTRIENAGDANGEHGVFFANATGTAVIDNSTVFNARRDLVHVAQTSTGLTLEVRNGSVLEFAAGRTAADFAGSAIVVAPNGTSAVTVSVIGSTFRNIVGNSLRMAATAAGASGSSSLTFASNQVTSTVAGKGGSVLVQGLGSTTTVVSVTDNVFTNVSGNGLVNADAKNTSTVRGTIARNSISDAQAAGIVVTVDDGGTSRVVVDDNKIRRVGSDAIQASNFGGAGTSSLDVVVTNNSIDTHSTSPGTAFLGGIVVFGFEDNTCLALTGNTVLNAAAGFSEVYLENGGGSFQYEEVPNTAAVGNVTPAFVQSQNTAASVSVNGAVALSNGVSCARPFLHPPSADPPRAITIGRERRRLSGSAGGLGGPEAVSAEGAAAELPLPGGGRAGRERLADDGSGAADADVAALAAAQRLGHQLRRRGGGAQAHAPALPGLQAQRRAAARGDAHLVGGAVLHAHGDAVDGGGRLVRHRLGVAAGAAARGAAGEKGHQGGQRKSVHASLRVLVGRKRGAADRRVGRPGDCAYEGGLQVKTAS